MKPRTRRRIILLLSKLCIFFAGNFHRDDDATFLRQFSFIVTNMVMNFCLERTATANQKGWVLMIAQLLQVKPRYNIPWCNVLPRYNVEKNFPLICAHINQPQYNVIFNVTLKNFCSHTNIISRLHFCICTLFIFLSSQWRQVNTPEHINYFLEEWIYSPV